MDGWMKYFKLICITLMLIFISCSSYKDSYDIRVASSDDSFCITGDDVLLKKTVIGIKLTQAGNNDYYDLIFTILSINDYSSFFITALNISYSNFNKAILINTPVYLKSHFLCENNIFGYTFHRYEENWNSENKLLRIKIKEIFPSSNTLDKDMDSFSMVDGKLVRKDIEGFLELNCKLDDDELTFKYPIKISKYRRKRTTPTIMYTLFPDM